MSDYPCLDRAYYRLRRKQWAELDLEKGKRCSNEKLIEFCDEFLAEFFAWRDMCLGNGESAGGEA